MKTANQTSNMAFAKIPSMHSLCNAEWKINAQAIHSHFVLSSNSFSLLSPFI
jgi:hypothetical protein